MFENLNLFYEDLYELLLLLNKDFLFYHQKEMTPVIKEVAVASAREYMREQAGKQRR